MNITSTESDMIVTFSLHFENDIKVRDGVISVNGIIKSHRENILDNTSFNIIYDHSYIDGDNNIEITVYCYDINGELHSCSYSHVHNKGVSSPLFYLNNHIKNNDNVDFNINIQSDFDNIVSIDVYSNNVKVQTVDFNNDITTSVPLDLLNSYHNNISFLLNRDDNVKFLFRYKCIYKEDVFKITNKWIFTKEIKSEHSNQVSRVSYIHSGDVTCCYTTDCSSFFEIKNKECFDLNSNKLRLLFMIFDDSILKSYKVEFHNLIL